MRFIKLLSLIIHIKVGFALTLAQLGIRRRSGDHPAYRSIVKWWLDKICRILNIQITVHGEPSPEVALLASNHISWLDIPVLGSVVNPSFLSKEEVRNWPIIGWLAEKAGTVFIKRGNKEAVHFANKQMLDRLQGTAEKAARHVLFFPEGTTSDGTEVKPFKGRLFTAAIEGNIPVQPVLLIFPDTEHGVNQAIPFTGDQDLLSNVMDILKRSEHAADIYFLEPITDTHNYTPRQLARHCESILRDKFVQVFDNNTL